MIIIFLYLNWDGSELVSVVRGEQHVGGPDQAHLHHGVDGVKVLLLVLGDLIFLFFFKKKS